jgi:hypothetical protein
LLYVIVYLDVDKALQVGPVDQPPLIEQKFPEYKLSQLIIKFLKSKDVSKSIKRRMCKRSSLGYPKGAATHYCTVAKFIVYLV